MQQNQSIILRQYLKHFFIVLMILPIFAYSEDLVEEKEEFPMSIDVDSLKVELVSCKMRESSYKIQDSSYMEYSIDFILKTNGDLRRSYIEKIQEMDGIIIYEPLVYSTNILTLDESLVGKVFGGMSGMGIRHCSGRGPCPEKPSCPEACGSDAEKFLKIDDFRFYAMDIGKKTRIEIRILQAVDYTVGRRADDELLKIWIEMNSDSCTFEE